MFLLGPFELLLQNISTGLEQFWDDFPNKSPSDPWTHPPTSIVNSDLNFLFSPIINAGLFGVNKRERFENCRTLEMPGRT